MQGSRPFLEIGIKPVDLSFRHQKCGYMHARACMRAYARKLRNTSCARNQFFPLFLSSPLGQSILKDNLIHRYFQLSSQLNGESRIFEILFFL